MKNNKFHIGENSGEGFPEPGVPASEAWKQMHQLLVENEMTTPLKKDKRRKLLLFLLLFLLIGIAGIIGYNSFVRHETVKAVVTNSAGKDAATSSQNNNDVIGDSSLLNAPGDTDDDAFQNKAKANNPAAIDRNVNLNPAQQVVPLSDDPAKAFTKDAEEEKVIIGAQTGIYKDSSDSETTIDSSVPAQNDTNYIVQTENNPQPVSPDEPSSLKNTANKNSGTHKFHFGLQWNINFSLKNNSNYFEAYNGNKQYYMWVLPSAWAKMDIDKRNSLLLHVNPYSQQFAGSQVLNIERPLIASIEPDIVTKLVKTRGFNFGLKYEYGLTDRIDIAAGLGYTIQQNALYLELAVEPNSGNVLSEKVYGAKKSAASFKYLRPSYLSWNGSVKYNLHKISIGAGIARPINDLSSNPGYTARPFNGELYLQFRFK